MYVDNKSQIERWPHQTMTNIIGNKDTKQIYWDRGINILNNFFLQKKLSLETIAYSSKLLKLRSFFQSFGSTFFLLSFQNRFAEKEEEI